MRETVRESKGRAKGRRMSRPRTTTDLVLEAERAVLAAVTVEGSGLDPRDLVASLPQSRQVDPRAVSLAVLGLLREGRLSMTESNQLVVPGIGGQA